MSADKTPESRWLCSLCGQIVPGNHVVGAGYGHEITFRDKNGYSQDLCGPLTFVETPTPPSDPSSPNSNLQTPFPK